jgi:hypothetical protein
MMTHGLANPEFKKLVLLYVTYPWRTLGTSWCILLKKKSYYQAQRDYTVEGSYILVDLCELTFYWR